MTKVFDQSKDQQRWDDYGRRRMAAMQENPDKFILAGSPYSGLNMHDELMKSLGPLDGKKVLELGCGRGDFSVFLAKQGAKVTAIDIGPALMTSASLLAAINKVDCLFQQASITQLPFEAAAFDIVVGIQILHHLSHADLIKAVQQAHTVLKQGGSAVFYEPVENSKTFDFIQNLFPAGKKGGHYRPSILQRKSWREYVESLDDRPLTTAELIAAGSCFGAVKTQPFGLLIRLDRLFGLKSRRFLNAMDKALLSAIPPLGYFCQSILVRYYKS